MPQYGTNALRAFEKHLYTADAQGIEAEIPQTPGPAIQTCPTEQRVPTEPEKLPEKRL
jgi:hypothetical protein